MNEDCDSSLPSWLKPVKDWTREKIELPPTDPMDALTRYADSLVEEAKARGRVRSFGTSFGSPYSTEYFHGPPTPSDGEIVYTAHIEAKNPWDISRETTMQRVGATKNHPNAFKRKDGKTQCPDCHALSLDATALDSIRCTVDPAKPASPMDRFHLGDTPPVEGKLGDIWVDAKGTMRVMTAEGGDELKDDEFPKVKRGVWSVISSKVRDAPIYPARWTGEVNSHAVEAAIARRVGYLKTMADTEVTFYKTEMMKELLEYAQRSNLILLTVPEFVLSASPGMDGMADVTLRVLARERPSTL